MPIIPAKTLSGQTFEIKLPDGLYDQVGEKKTIEMNLTDKKGNKWEVKPFYLFQRQVELSPLDEDKQKMLADYEDKDE